MSDDQRNTLIKDAFDAARRTCEAWPPDAWLAGGFMDMHFSESTSFRDGEFAAWSAIGGASVRGSSYAMTDLSGAMYTYVPKDAA